MIQPDIEDRPMTDEELDELEQLQQDMGAPDVDEHIQTSMELTRALGFSGTPSFVIGDELIPGYVEAQRLIDQVETTRAQQE